MWVAGMFLLFAIIAGFYSFAFFFDTYDQEAEAWQLTFRAGMTLFCALACGSRLGIACGAVDSPVRKASRLRAAQMPAVGFRLHSDANVLTGRYAVTDHA